ncbi:flagellar biosynthetic protein FlhB [Paenibacillus sp. IHB B 3084]|uniref:flagellar biosynthesis protein FlhB n=1 Tax=unclassified Paenibacillus TaxID=185978 RepID=UPI000721D8B4|nr:flagellar biosynthesis protein FlhB [Paenibacillus sp. IHB B 3084]ALP35013.1 flagellar biosynthetic protein FlhB [Paenibacillus sp. IHB B 3084]
MSGLGERSLSFKYAMNLQLFSGEKTEKATPKKKQDARQKGQVAKSMELPAAGVLLVTFFCLMIFGGYFKDHAVRLFRDIFVNRLSMEVTPNTTMLMMGEYGVQIMIMLAPIFIGAIVIGVAANYMQIGFLLTGEGITPKFSKIDPIKGFKNIFSMRSLVEFLKSVLKMTVIGYLVYSVLWKTKADLPKLAEMSGDQMLSFTASLTMELGLKIGVVLFVLAVLDYMYQRYEHEKNLKMSKQDIKDEYKKMEGDPLIKGKIRERQRRMAMQRMMQEVPNADVIITNPTHFAVALKYDGSEMEAPQIIAKGQDYVALRIKEIAKQNGVITMENKPLARALFQRAEIGDAIPADLFQAVAEVLAYVYKLKGKVK